MISSLFTCLLDLIFFFFAWLFYASRSTKGKVWLTFPSSGRARLLCPQGHSLLSLALHHVKKEGNTHSNTTVSSHQIKGFYSEDRTLWNPLYEDFTRICIRQWSLYVFSLVSLSLITYNQWEFMPLFEPLESWNSWLRTLAHSHIICLLVVEKWSPGPHVGLLVGI